MQITIPSILVYLVMSVIVPHTTSIGSRQIGLPGHYDRAYTSVDPSGAPLPISSSDAWRSHNMFSSFPIFQRSQETRGHPILPAVRFAGDDVHRDRESRSEEEVIRPEDWRIGERVPFIPESQGRGMPAASPPVWDPDVSPFVAGAPYGQEDLEPPAHQYDDGHRNERIRILSNFFNH